MTHRASSPTVTTATRFPTWPGWSCTATATAGSASARRSAEGPAPSALGERRQAEGLGEGGGPVGVAAQAGVEPVGGDLAAPRRAGVGPDVGHEEPVARGFGADD